MVDRTNNHKHELSKRIIQSLYPIACRNGHLLPLCFKQNQRHSDSTNWESFLPTNSSISSAVSLTLQDSRLQLGFTWPLTKFSTNRPIPLCCSIYYYEITVNSKNAIGSLLVGFAPADCSKNRFANTNHVLGYSSNTGQISWNEDPLPVTGPTFGEGDVVGCGINFVTNSAFFTKNGLLVSSVSVPVKVSTLVYPCVVQLSPTTKVTGNFGQHNFSFAIEQYITQERSNAVSQAIDTRLTPDLTNVKMRSIVFDYLVRNGYLEVAQTMVPNGLKRKTTASDVEVAVNSDPLQPVTVNGYSAALTNGSLEKLATSEVDQQHTIEEARKDTKWVCDDEVWPETPDMVRCRIGLTSLIQAGHYQEAIARLHTDYPGLVQRVPSLVFMLRCRHFIELLFACQTITKPVVKGSSPIILTQHSGSCKRAQPTSSPECSPISAQNGRASMQTHYPKDTSPAPIRMKLDHACLEEQEKWEPVEDGEDDEDKEENSNDDSNTVAYLERNLDGPVGVQTTVSTRNELSAIKKKKKRALMNLIKCASSPPDDVLMKQTSMIPNSNVSQNGKHPAAVNSELSLDAAAPATDGDDVASCHSDTFSDSSSNNSVDNEQMANNFLCAGAETMDLTNLVMLGRELREMALQLRTSNAISSTQLTLLENAFSLVAYDNPFESPFSHLAHVRHRKTLAKSVNNAILVSLGRGRFPLVEMSISQLEQAMLEPKPNVSEPKSPEAAPSSSSTLTPQPLRVQRQQSPSTSSSGSRHQHHHYRRRSHRTHMVTSALMVTSTSITAVPGGTSSQTVQLHPTGDLSNLPFTISSSTPPSEERVEITPGTLGSSSTRSPVRLRNTIVQSSPMYRIGYYSSSSSTEGYSQIVPVTLYTSSEPPPDTHPPRASMMSRGVTSSSARPALNVSNRQTNSAGGEDVDGRNDFPVEVGSEFAGFFHPALFLI